MHKLVRLSQHALQRPTTLAYAEYGRLSSDNVVFYQHGWPGSRIGGSMLHEAALAHNVRVIAVDRPGFGSSPFTPDHTLQSWADSLHQLAGKLGIEHYSILGASGGAPFAAACAKYSPPGAVKGLGLLCPLGPINSSTSAGMALANSAGMALAQAWPAMARGIWQLSRCWMSWDEHCMSRFVLNPKDKEAVKAAPRIAQAIRAAVLEGLASGGHGVVHEMSLVQRCWGFKLADIQVQHGFMWHGLQDPLVPFPMAKAYESISGCQATYFPEETHTTLVINKLAHALEALAQQQQRQQQQQQWQQQLQLLYGHHLQPQQMLHQHLAYPKGGHGEAAAAATAATAGAPLTAVVAEAAAAADVTSILCTSAPSMVKATAVAGSAVPAC